METNPKKKFFGEDRRIFLAGMLANIVYLMVAAAFASNLFEKFNPVFKATMFIVTVLLAILSILIYPAVKEKEA